MQGLWPQSSTCVSSPSTYLPRSLNHLYCKLPHASLDLSQTARGSCIPAASFCCLCVHIKMGFAFCHTSVPSATAKLWQPARTSSSRPLCLSSGPVAFRHVSECSCRRNMIPASATRHGLELRFPRPRARPQLCSGPLVVSQLGAGCASPALVGWPAALHFVLQASHG